MLSRVSIYELDCFDYPSKIEVFRPSKVYPEYPFKEIAEHENKVYDAIRESFIINGFDKEHIGSTEWNPLMDKVKPGDCVLLKPNMVMHTNGCKLGDERSLYTNPSVVAALIDYVTIALKGKGEIIVGDAPMQECKFDTLVKESGYGFLIDYYKKKGINIKLVDFRELTSIVENGVHISTLNNEARGKVIDIGMESDFFDASAKEIANMRITNYDPQIMTQHHSKEKHEYYISEYALKADVIINIPKPKCHRKAGMTASLKNFVGLNVRKEFLPHHTKGAKNAGGDEYDRKNIIHDIRSKLLDCKNRATASNHLLMVQVYRFLIKLCSLVLKVVKANKYDEGSWYGNRTISRTISDINRIIYYADKQGKLQEKQQRKFFIVGDMVISGEGEGPVLPQNKECGIIVMGDNPIAFDKTVATIMGFDFKKIPAIINAERKREKYIIEDGTPKIISNSDKYNNMDISKFDWDKSFKFIATSGWINHIELK